MLNLPNLVPGVISAEELNALKAENAALKQENASLKQQLATCQSDCQNCQHDLATCQTSLNAAQDQISEQQAQIAFYLLVAADLDATRQDRTQISLQLEMIRSKFNEYMEETINRGLSPHVDDCVEVCQCWMAPYIKIAKDL